MLDGVEGGRGAKASAWKKGMVQGEEQVGGVEDGKEDAGESGGGVRGKWVVVRLCSEGVAGEGGEEVADIRGQMLSICVE